MRKSYDMKIWELKCQGKISNEYAQELLKKHREELEKALLELKGKGTIIIQIGEDNAKL